MPRSRISYFSDVIPRRILINHPFSGTSVGITTLELFLAKVSNKDLAGVPIHPGPFPSQISRMTLCSAPLSTRSGGSSKSRHWHSRNH